MVISRMPELLLKAVPESVARQEPRSELTSVTPAAAKGHVLPQGLIGHLGPCWSPGAMMPLGPYRSKWHVLLSNARAAAGGHVWDHGPTAIRVCVNVCLLLP